MALFINITFVLNFKAPVEKKIKSRDGGEEFLEAAEKMEGKNDFAVLKTILRSVTNCAFYFRGSNDM